jgi:hypothetical protein
MTIAAQLSRIAARLDRLEQAARPPAPMDALMLAERIGLALDGWQVRAVQSRSQALLLCCGRQVGKSTVLMLLILEQLLRPDRTIIISAPSERQTVLSGWRKIGRPVRHTSVTRTSVELINNTRLLAMPADESTTRGVSSVDLLVAEEASRVPDVVYSALSPMLSVSNGRLIGASTPAGRRGWWHALWNASPLDDPDIERIMVTSEECPRIAASFLARERRRVGEFWYEQEYLCQFLEDEEQLVSDEHLAAALSPTVRPLFEAG